MDAQRVLVTGGTGYLARWCIRLLAERGYTVQTTLRDPSRQAELRSLSGAAGGAEPLRVFAADLRGDEGWREAVAGCDYVLHVASPFPRLGFAFADVRDVADLHIRAMTTPAAAGQRFLGAGPFLWLADLAAILRAELGPQAAKVPQRQAPNWLVRLMARVDPSVRSVVGELGQRSDYSTEKARTVLGWSPRPARESVLDCARSILAPTPPAPAEAPQTDRPAPAR